MTMPKATPSGNARLSGLAPTHPGARFALVGATLNEARQVEIEIRSTYVGQSRRPDTIRVDYYINGKHRFKVFRNTPKGK